MRAHEAFKIYEKASVLRHMPEIYNKIKEAAEAGYRQLYIGKSDITKIQIDILKDDGYKVTESWEENSRQPASDIFLGWLINW